MVGIHRSTMRLHPGPATAEDDELRAWLRRFFIDRPRWGWRRAAVMARRAGWTVNNKRIRRLCVGGLRVPHRRRKKRMTGIGVTVGAMLRGTRLVVQSLCSLGLMGRGPL